MAKQKEKTSEVKIEKDQLWEYSMDRGFASASRYIILDVTDGYVIFTAFNMRTGGYTENSPMCQSKDTFLRHYSECAEITNKHVALSDEGELYYADTREDLDEFLKTLKDVKIIAIKKMEIPHVKEQPKKEANASQGNVAQTILYDFDDDFDI